MKSLSANSSRVPVTVFLALLVLTGLTAGAARINLGSLNTTVALLIAGAKALLVILYFMDARHSTRMTFVVLGAGILWMAILVGLTLADFVSRGWALE